MDNEPGTAAELAELLGVAEDDTGYWEPAPYALRWAEVPKDHFGDYEGVDAYGRYTGEPDFPFFLGNPNGWDTARKFTPLGPVVANQYQATGRPRPELAVLDPARWMPAINERAVCRDLRAANLLRGIADRLGRYLGSGETADGKVRAEQSAYRALADQLDARALETWLMIGDRAKAAIIERLAGAQPGQAGALTERSAAWH
jgi:hypothetical protein